MMSEQLSRIDAALAEVRRAIEVALSIIRTLQHQQTELKRGVAAFLTELQATRSRIEKKLDEG